MIMIDYDDDDDGDSDDGDCDVKDDNDSILNSDYCKDCDDDGTMMLKTNT